MTNESGRRPAQSADPTGRHAAAQPQEAETEVPVLTEVVDAADEARDPARSCRCSRRSRANSSAPCSSSFGPEFTRLIEERLARALSVATRDSRSRNCATHWSPDSTRWCARPSRARSRTRSASSRNVPRPAKRPRPRWRDARHLTHRAAAAQYNFALARRMRARIDRIRAPSHFSNHDPAEEFRSCRRRGALVRALGARRRIRRRRRDAARPSFCIQLPPPNVTGLLHMGHAFNQTIMDALTRYHRMCGRQCAVAARHRPCRHRDADRRRAPTRAGGQFARSARARSASSRRSGNGRPSSGSTITQQMRRLGDSCDWDREYFTMDDKLSPVVIETFVRLYEQGLIYRGKRLVNWDPVLLTAVSDLEVESEEEDGQLWHIRYPLADGSGHLTVATTRPETMLGDTAVMVHPEDDRVPLADRQAGRAAADRAHDPRDRGRLCRPRIRHRLREGHAGARFQRLAGWPASRPAAHRAC